MSDDEISRRHSLQELEKRLNESRKKAGLNPETATAPRDSDAGRALHASIEFVVAICVGTGLGYAIGLFTDAVPVGIILGMIVGFAAGFRGILRVMQVDFSGKEKEQDGHGRNTD